MNQITCFSFILLLVFTLLPYSDCDARQSRDRDVVILKNGSELRGEIIEMNEDSYVRIRIFDNNIISLPAGEISKITSELIADEVHYKTSGYINRTGLELIPGGGSTTPRFYMVNGYQFNEYVGTGIGIGFTPYNDPLTLMPLFVDFNLRLQKQNYSPVLFVKFGYNVSLGHDDDMDLISHTGGLLFNAGLGLQFNLSSGFGWFLNAGYNIDNSRYEFDTWGPQTVREDVSFRRVNFGIGLTF